MVDVCVDVGMIDIGMYCVGEVYWCGVGRQFDNVFFWGENVNFIGEQIGFYVFDKFK